jgi:hypothetical protein
MRSSAQIISSPSREEFVALTRPLIGLPVSHAWRGYGTAMFLEFGALTMPGPSTPRSRNSKGEATLMVEWSWRVETRGAVQFGSWSGNKKMDNGIQRLKARTVLNIDLVGRLPEVYIALSGQRWVHTFQTREGQPEWTVFLPDRTWITFRGGRIVRERGTRTSNHAMERTADRSVPTF